MNIRQEVEKTIAAFAITSNVQVAYEGVPFTPPKGPWLEVIFLDSQVTNPMLDGEAIRNVGIIQINCRVLDGKGLKELTQLTDSIVALFPFTDKARYQTFTVEQTPNVSATMTDEIYRLAAVRVKYRQEL